jgi:hypothetical protein
MPSDGLEVSLRSSKGGTTHCNSDIQGPIINGLQMFQNRHLRQTHHTLRGLNTHKTRRQSSLPFTQHIPNLVKLPLPILGPSIPRLRDHSQHRHRNHNLHHLSPGILEFAVAIVHVVDGQRFEIELGFFPEIFAGGGGACGELAVYAEVAGGGEFEAGEEVE